MVVLHVMGVDVLGACLTKCEAAYLPFPPRFFNKICSGVGMGVRDGVASQNVTQKHFEGALGCKPRANWWHFFMSWVKT